MGADSNSQGGNVSSVAGAARVAPKILTVQDRRAAILYGRTATEVQPLTLIEFASQFLGWRGAYFRYAGAIAGVAHMQMPREFEFHRERAIARRSGIFSTDGLAPSNSKRIAKSKASTHYDAVTERNYRYLVDYKLVQAVHNGLRAADLTVTARNAAGTIEILRPVDIGAARLEFAANRVTIGRFVYTQVQVMRVLAAPSPEQGEGFDRPKQGPPAPLTKGEIPDGQHIEKMLTARRRYKSWAQVIAKEIDLNQVAGLSPEAKRKRLTKKAAAAHMATRRVAG